MTKKDTIICAGFPGIGKSYFFNSNKILKILDSDSSKFHKDSFPQNYVRHIKKTLGSFDIILISSHDIVRQELVKQELDFTLIYPNRKLKKEYLERYKKRGDSTTFIELVENNWHKWITELQNQENCKKIELKTGQYLCDIQEKIIKTEITNRYILDIALTFDFEYSIDAKNEEEAESLFLQMTPEASIKDLTDKHGIYSVNYKIRNIEEEEDD
jgi:hypothetical protein